MAHELALAYLRRFPTEAAWILNATAAPALAQFARALPAGMLQEVLPLLAPHAAATCLGAWPVDAAVQLLVDLDPVTAARVAAALPREQRVALRARLPIPLGQLVDARLSHLRGSVGACMEPAVALLSAEPTVAAARRTLAGATGRVFPTVFVLDPDRRPLAAVSLVRVALEREDAALADLYERVPRPLHARAMLAAERDNPGWAQYDHLPVVDADGVFVGVLARVDLYRSLEAESASQQPSADLSEALLTLAEILWAPGARLIADAAASTIETNGQKRS
ncbi:MAG: hypothetical protein IT495_03990 [Gammaproteobacteria bacterium]|nr:hypothetical protein [Gammaproteobacteria bacterium]